MTWVPTFVGMVVLANAKQNGGSFAFLAKFQLRRTKRTLNSLLETGSRLNLGGCPSGQGMSPFERIQFPISLLISSP